VGPQFERSKALYFKASDIFLLPGAVGLAILDSFAFETPLITMEYKFHGPEFEYIINEYNAVVSEQNLTDYVAKIEELLLDSQKIKLLKEAAKLMIKKYNLQCMVANFIDGIEKALV
ncbi:MAG: glycosyltransferase, partial [Ferruginibacter sp.]